MCVWYLNQAKSPLSLVSHLISPNLTTHPFVRTGGIADLVKHKWFGPFDWKGLRKGTIQAPFVPDLSENKPHPADDDGADDLVVRRCCDVHAICLCCLFLITPCGIFMC